MDDSLTLLIDAPSLYYRALFSTPDDVRTPAGQPINAAYGFFNMLARLVRSYEPNFLACALDSDWRPAWRVELLPQYKDFRAAPGSAQESAEELLEHQVPVIEGFLEMCDVASVGHPGYEAEDVIGTLATRAPGQVVIVSGDRDLFQLVRDPKIVVHFPIKGPQPARVTEAYISEKYGIPGRSYLDYAVLRGDPSDGLPGVKGVGEKTASALVAKHGGIDGIFAAIEKGEESPGLAKVRRDMDYVSRARQVTTIATALPIEELDLARPAHLPRDEILEAARAVGLMSPMRSFLDALSGSR